MNTDYKDVTSTCFTNSSSLSGGWRSRFLTSLTGALCIFVALVHSPASRADQISDLQSQVAALTQANAEMSAEIASLQAGINVSQYLYDSANAAVEAANEALCEFNAAYYAQSQADDALLDQLQTAWDGVNTSINNLDPTSDFYESDLENLESERDSIGDQMQSIRDDLADMAWLQQPLEQAYSDACAALQNLSTSYADDADRIVHLQQQIEINNEAIEEANCEIYNLQSQNNGGGGDGGGGSGGGDGGGDGGDN